MARNDGEDKPPKIFSAVARTLAKNAANKELFYDTLNVEVNVTSKGPVKRKLKILSSDDVLLPFLTSPASMEASTKLIAPDGSVPH